MNSLDGGYKHSCGVGGDDSAYCWGEGASGELGAGEVAVSSREPVRVHDGANASGTWASVAAGSNYFSCGIGGNGKAYCWGSRTSYGQLGDDSTVGYARVPVAVAADDTTWSVLSAGDYHTCGLSTDKEAYCWGRGTEGQLGQGNSANSSVPVAVSGGPSSWAWISAGDQHSCGVGTDRKAYCWGNGLRGALGNGGTSSSVLPVVVSAGANAGGVWKSVVAGYFTSCGIGGDDLAYCWGGNYWGQLGNGVVGNQYEPVRVVLPAGVKVRMLAMHGYAQHVCALSTDARIFCWGQNTSGQLGMGSSDDSAGVPVEVSMSASLATGRPKMVAVGTSTSFAVSRFGPDPDPDPGPGPGPSPQPAPVVPPSAPRDVTALPGDASAAVSWQPPESSGSFPVTHFQVTATPGGKGCLVLAAEQSCAVTALANGATYSFTVRALNGAGWGPDSGASNAVVPQAPQAKLLLITGSRGAGSDAGRVFVSGTSKGLVGDQAVPWMRFPGQAEFMAGSRVPAISSDGTFAWQRKTGRRVTVYFIADGLRSNTVIIPAR